ncbi:MAG: hypothetical protein LC541_04535 [Candidatus Thiodiazotropha sp.]|nr:hypothetical protein [Candidatus Thiodiazotropha sp.]MCM8882584.1 hypothetical protein [Candidatus Thiodiazotropha sp.]MCM8918775.1 hypothetical protein [Candidatus Thiodiazotropha sp.]
MSDDKKILDPNRPLKLSDLLSVSILHERCIAELNTQGVDASVQLEQQKIVDEVINRFLDLSYDQLLRADVNNPDHMAFLITSTDERSGYKRLINDLREKYFDSEVDVNTLH